MFALPLPPLYWSAPAHTGSEANAQQLHAYLTNRKHGAAVMEDARRMFHLHAVVQQQQRGMTHAALPVCRVDGGMTSGDRVYPADLPRYAPVPVRPGPLVRMCSGAPADGAPAG